MTSRIWRIYPGRDWMYSRCLTHDELLMFGKWCYRCRREAIE